MTDIQKHLKGIRKLVLQTLTSTPPAESIDLDALRDQLRAYLPDGYGISSGIVQGQSGESLPVQILIYDAAHLPDENAKQHINHALLILDLDPTYDAEAFAAALHRTQTVKALKPPPTKRKRGKDEHPPGTIKIPASRLPYTMICGRRYVSTFEDADPALFAHLHKWVSAYPPEHRPDEILFQDQAIRYLHPLIERGDLVDMDMGWSRSDTEAKPRHCYVCKQVFTRLHFHYPRLCVRCGDFNYIKRTQSADLSGYIALVTGGRIKIGYETCLRLLRAGAQVITTTRFPRTAAGRFGSERDFAEWESRLHIYGIDFRQITLLESFIEELYAAFPHLDILINNAAQTIKRPPEFYAHLLPLEQSPLHSLPPPIAARVKNATESAHLSLVTPITPVLSAGEGAPNGDAWALDHYGEQVDPRDYHSWVMPLDEVSITELVEVHLINAVAPAVLMGRLKPLMMRSPHAHQFVINVSANEGRFAAPKRDVHPHTNMAKAALNMLTRSTAETYARDGIYVNSIDPGWVSDQIPRSDAEATEKAAELLPIDMIDATARLCDPIFSAFGKQNVLYGRYLKDYQSVTW